MKKLLKVMALILAFALAFSLVGCSAKKPITAEKFEEIMEGENYKVTCGTMKYLGDDNEYHYVEYRYARFGNTPMFEFAVYSSEEDAKDEFEKVVEKTKNQMSDASDVKITKKSSGDYEKVTSKAKDIFIEEYCWIHIRYKNTILSTYRSRVWSWGDIETDEKITDALLSKLGY